MMINNSRVLLSDNDRDIFIAQQILKREYKGFYMLKMYALDNFSAFQIEMDDKIYPPPSIYIRQANLCRHLQMWQNRFKKADHLMKQRLLLICQKMCPLFEKTGNK